ncbi:ABC transporter permease [Geothrix sp. 21YS21S-4]|uniref:cell division protein FtsX n=1 Tax=Geothrix sp. 21YS21S-4 TaxID=3068889 RepID=UPI0027B9F6BA|nr:permease-like cell division protein FtsX [Geothrix sp. 21YS21S-4]
MPLRLLGLLLQDVVRDLFRHRGQYLLAILTLASGLLLAGGGLLLVESLGRFTARLEGMAKVVAYAAEGKSLDEAEARLRRDPRFREVRRVSAEENRKRFQSATREAGLLLESAGQDALPESLELTLRPDLASGPRAVDVGESLRSLPGVGDVLADQERLEQLQRMARMVRSALMALGVILLMAAGFATGNVIRMSILAREEEITIMRLVGASESYIRTPLLLEGALLGLGGSVLAILGLFALWLPLSRGVGGLSPLLVELARLGFFSPWSMLLLALLGAGTGALGALWAFWITRRVQREQAALMEGAG